MSDDIKKYEPEYKARETRGKGFGRPPKYDDEMLEQAYDYIMGGWKETGQQVPSKVGLALYLGVVSSTVDKWELEGNSGEAEHENKVDFSGICKAVMDMQHQCLMNNGLTGLFVAPITKMMLTKHGYSDKVENVNTNTERKVIYIDPDEKADIEKNIADVVDD